MHSYAELRDVILNKNTGDLLDLLPSCSLNNTEILVMITRHHLALALICALIVFSPLIFSNPLIVAIIGAGTCLGAILPDIHMSRPKHFSLRTLAWGVVQIPKILCALALGRIYARWGDPISDPSDKRLTHSLPGVLFIATCASVFLYIPALLANSAYAGYIGLFLGGIFLGMGLHLAEDLCTRKGIFPFFPVQCDESCRFHPPLRPKGFPHYPVPHSGVRRSRYPYPG